MATQEKLQKSLDALKISKSNQQSAETTKKKEKVQHCYIITEAISNPTIRISTNFLTLLGNSIEVFLKLCEDQDADIRMISEECLNRIIRVSNGSHIRRIQIELHKEIKQNGAVRSLRMALWLFSMLAHHIKPHKGKPYVVNLFPSIIKITERNEESLHETLALSLPKIMKSLGYFTTENEIKVLLKAFLTKIDSDSTVIRRTTTSSLLSICINCRKPDIFVSHCLNYILDMLVPVSDTEKKSQILGAISCMKSLIPNLKSDGEVKDCDNEKLLQVFELCIHYLHHKDHNIINVCLETLNTVFQNCNTYLIDKFVNGIGCTRIYSPLSKIRSPSQLSMITNTTTGDENLFSESELTETIHCDIEKWIDESKLSVMNITFAKTKDKSQSLENINDFGHQTIKRDVYDYGKLNELSSKNFVSKLKTHSFGDNLDGLAVSENSSDKSVSGSLEDKISNEEEEEEMQEIETGDITDNQPLLYCIRLITKLFLLNGTPGGCISDKLVRVSVKHLALSCLSTIFQILPAGLFVYLDKNYDNRKNFNKRLSNQKLSDILLFSQHNDPQLRGVVRTLIANFRKTVALLCKGDYEEWIKENADINEAEKLFTEKLINVFLQGLHDESAICIRQTLISLDTCLKYLIESQKSLLVTPLLDTLPILANNPYWLVKVSLCDLVAKIDYVTIHFIMENNNFQQKVIFNVLFELLGDNDQRVRSSAAHSIIRIIPYLYFEEYQTKQKSAISKAIWETERLIRCLKEKEEETTVNKKHFIEQMPFPFSQISIKGCDRIDFTLSKIIVYLCNSLVTSTSKHITSGCVETLCLLSNAYPCTVYKNAWCTKDFKDSEKHSDTQIPDLLSLCISLLTNSTHVYDLQTHINILTLSANLYAGNSMSLTRPLVDFENSRTLWSMFSNEAFANLSEQYLSHIVKLLNIFHHVLNEVVPLHPQSKPSLPNLPSTTNLSPLKRRKSDLDKKSLVSGKFDKEEKHDKKDYHKVNCMGTFVNSSHYLKIFDLLKNAFINYKLSLDSEASQTFLELLITNLHCLCVLMEIGSLAEFSRIAEDILTYFRSTFVVEAPTTVVGVQQLLKCLIGTNLTANIMEFTVKESNQEEFDDGFYYKLFQRPYSHLSQYIHHLKSLTRCDFDDDTLMGYLHRKDVRRRSVVLSRSSDKILANYIRIFEPMVIKSLEQYTITSDVLHQSKVLQLLTQLVKLRVNYCLLDSEQVFIGFVLKQFEFIEEGQISLTEELIPKIFQFLVQLSYSKQHSKSIISVPKIIQLCDGLMASGQPALTHCIPALEPIVEDIFLTRNKSNTVDMKELETTREVILSMLLRLSENKKVLDLITLILDDSKCCIDNTEKWFNWSKLVFSVIFPMLKQNKLKLDETGALISMRRFILALNPEVFKPFDDIIIMFFEEPPVGNDGHSKCWLSKILILLLIIIPLKEKTLLTKIDRLKSNFSPSIIFQNVVTKADPLNVNNNADTFSKVPAEIIFFRFLLRVISIASKECLTIIEKEKDIFLIEQFSTFLVHCLYIFQEGSHCEITKTATSILNKSIPVDKNDVIQLNNINNNFINLGYFYPVLTFQWCSFLTVLNHKDKWIYLHILENIVPISTRIKNPSINIEIMKIGSAISFCDYLNENMTETDHIKRFLSNNSRLLVCLCNEPPVSEFISSLHRNSLFSRIFIDSVSEHLNPSDPPIHRANILKCIENCHSSQIGAVINCLIPDMLDCPQAAVSRMTVNLACRKIELLSTLAMEDVNNQLSKENLVKIQKSLLTLNLVKKHETLVSLLNKLSVQYYDLNPLEFQQRRIVNPEYVKKLEINRKWYLSQIQTRYNDASVSKETAELLGQLEYNEIITFMSSSSFNKFCLKDCFRLGLANEEPHKMNEELVLIRASIDSLLRDVSSIISRIPQAHEVHNEKPPLCSLERESCSVLFENKEFGSLMYNVALCIPFFTKYLHGKTNKQISDNNYEELMKFSVTCLEYISFLNGSSGVNLKINLIDIFLTAADQILRDSKICNLLGRDCNISWFCSSAFSIFNIVNTLLKDDKPLPNIPYYGLVDTIRNVDTALVGEATYNLYTLTCWLYKQKAVNQTKIPDFLFNAIKSITICLSRLPVVNSYILIPSCAWKSGWQSFSLMGTFKTQVSQIPIEFLQEIDILEEYIFRITLLGWTSRQQFEESWMCLLSVLCRPLDDLDPLEINDVVHTSSLAMKAITTLLLQTLTCSNVGDPNSSDLIHVSRNADIGDDSICIKKLQIVQDKIQNNYQDCSKGSNNCDIMNVFRLRNFEKFSKNYSYGQVSIEYFLTMISFVKESDNSVAAEICRSRKKILEECGLDINSCLQFLIDYYTQLMRHQTSTHIRILHEAIRSVITISDLFMDKSQFTWMMDIFLELSKLHTVEDELLHQYLIIGICKAVAVLTPELEVYEQVKRLLMQYLKSPYLSSRIASLYGILYILEGCKLSNITIGGISEEMQLIIPCAVEYVQYNLDVNNVLKKSKEHSSLVWSLAFYLIENIEETYMQHNFVSNTLITAFNLLKEKTVNHLHSAILKALERLLITKNSYMLEKFGKQYLKLALEKMKQDNPSVAIMGTQLLLSYMYTDCREHLQSLQISANTPTNPEHLVQTIEKISAVFERIKKGYVYEVEILCSTLPTILDDFFTPSDILTKVIGEFLSPQQPHPKLLSKVVFQVFQSAISRDQLALLQDWVVFSLSNFTQSFSRGMATWCLTCFFISASSNKWLRYYFPYVQSRVGRYEYEDKKILCIAGADFYKNLTNEKQKQTFIDNFTKVKNQPDSPFNDLLLSL